MTEATAGRVQAIDLLRGVIMALMALDHTRDFFFGLAPDPTDLAAAGPALFGTRWITHVCAPGFLLLAGVSARLWGRGRTRGALSRHLLVRGALLVVLELTVITFVWIPDPGRGVVLLQVIWAIGWAMILLSGLIWLPLPLIGLIGLAAMLLHPLISPGGLALIGAPDWLHVLLLDGMRTLRFGTTDYIVAYAILPWAGVMAAGYALGDRFAGPSRTWRVAAVALGLAALAAFVAMRASGIGDPVGWQRQGEALLRLMTFVNVEKYPPSPAYLTMTLGLVLLLLAALAAGIRGRVGRWLAALGRAPLFFYVVHLYVLRAVGLTAAVAVWGVAELGPPPKPSTPEIGLGQTWLVWVVAMAALAWPTAWYARLKAQRRWRWLGFF